MRKSKTTNIFGGFIKITFGETMHSEKTLYAGCGLFHHDWDDTSYIGVSIGLIWVYTTLLIRIWRDADA